jgi:hypothetical protein
MVSYLIINVSQKPFKRRVARLGRDTSNMSTKPKEKVMAAIRKLFRSSDKIADQEGASGSTNSPSRRLLNRHHRPDIVTPVDGPIPENTDPTHADRNCFFKMKKSTKVNKNF